MYKMKDRVDVRASKLEDLKSYVLGGVRDDARTLFLHAEGFAVDQVTSDITNLRKLQLGRIDAFASDDYAVKELAKQSGIDPDSVEKLLRIDALSNGLNLAFSLKTPAATVERCRTALAQMKRDGTFKRITARWRSKP